MANTEQTFEEILSTLTDEQKNALEARKKYLKDQMFSGCSLYHLAWSFASINELLIAQPERKDFLLGQEKEYFEEICHYFPNQAEP